MRRPALFAYMLGVAVLTRCAGSLAQPVSAPAGVTSVRLEVVRDDAAGACPDAQQLQGAVAARLGYVPFDPAAERTVNVDIRGAAHGLQAELRISGGQGGTERVRTLESPGRDCGGLNEALVLAIGLAIDPLSPSRPVVAEVPPSTPAPAPASSAPVPPVAPPPPAAEPRAPPPPPPPPPSERLHAFLAVAPHLVLGAEPGLSGGAMLSVGVRVRRASLGLEGRFDVATTQAVAPQGEVQVGMRGAGLFGCFHPGVFALCGVTQLLALQAEGSGAPGAESAVGLLVTLGARVGVEWRFVERLWLRPALEMQVVTRTIELVWLGKTVWETSRVQGLLTLALGVDL